MPESPLILPRLGATWWQDVRVDAVAAFQALGGHDPQVPLAWLEDAVRGVSLIAVGGEVVEAESLESLKLGDALACGWIRYDGASRWLLPERWIAFDGDRAQLQSHGRPWVLPAAPEAPQRAARHVAAHPTLNDAEYTDAVRECQRWIDRGDSYVACLTTQWHGPAIDPVATHAQLRAANPVHRGGFLRLGETAIASISPERFLSVTNGKVTTSPIKGTRPRHTDPARDAAAADELRTSVKERAENVMIVDLCRNDLHKVCDAGTVSVSQLLEVESYPAVHQLVSSVRGRLAAGNGPIDAIRALFPAGSMTGAPKQRTIELLAELEPEPRGLYSGCFGWIAGGEAELSMTIRTVVATPQGTSFGVGGGVTALSDAEEETAEMHVKARTLAASLRR